MRRFVLAAVGAVGSAVLIGGCVGFDGKPQGKQLSRQKVQVKFAVCAASGTPTCTEQGNTEDALVRLLVGVRAPKGTGLPARFTAVGREEVFTRDRRYQRQLNELAPTPGKSRWTGWVSEPFPFTGGFPIPPFEPPDPASAKFRLNLDLPDGIGKRFRWRPVVGYQEVTEMEPPPPIDCGESIYGDMGESTATCADTPDNDRQTRRAFSIKLTK
jgi:hypothetical protein